MEEIYETNTKDDPVLLRHKNSRAQQLLPGPGPLGPFGGRIKKRGYSTKISTLGHISFI